ncbi:MAG TPA: hypothetical protein VGX23_09665 [Actinocrinis sp.]|nr:hypothetical protein [Actinocrinis sp.]
MTELCEAWWASTLHSAPATPATVSATTSATTSTSATTALTFLVPLTGELVPWLTTWSETDGPSAGHHVLALFDSWGHRLLEGALDLGISTEAPGLNAELTAWLLSELPRRGLVDGLTDADAERFLLLALPPDRRWR